MAPPAWLRDERPRPAGALVQLAGLVVPGSRPEVNALTVVGA